uniref:AlNc14C106G6242 protein n=1 Tax=Albugo laibachii Nc14 TaxID=890382 RepID=F0WI35_9STRA|nr:AlNc14C106G6242 [Albugo laibachii Nc14]|eukprot:CCA20913.1 AlNc14C106G6242 [Albugo laibachii Nc14]
MIAAIAYCVVIADILFWEMATLFVVSSFQKMCVLQTHTTSQARCDTKTSNLLRFVALLRSIESELKNAVLQIVYPKIRTSYIYNISDD